MASSPGDWSDENDKTYFGYYGQLTHQQNMLQDAVRTSAYFQAILKNGVDFRGKVVLDVGCGSGILSFFAAQAGAKRVYAVEAAGPMAEHAQRLAEANGWGGVVQVIHGQVEQVTLPEPVDVIISEPMGVLLVHERMLESYLVARDKWLSPVNGVIAPSQMFPATSAIHFAPFSDTSLYASVHEKALFWRSSSFFGVDLSALAPAAVDHFFGQPIVGGVEPKTLMAAASSFDVNFTQAKVGSLQDFAVPLNWTVAATGVCHGLAAWFDVEFLGSSMCTVLSTAPDCARTHWHQVRLVFRNPVALNRGQLVSGEARFVANDKRSYDVSIRVASGSSVLAEQTFALHDQQYWNINQSDVLPAEFNLDYLSIYPSTI